jgi:hypothetical protein
MLLFDQGYERRENGNLAARLRVKVVRTLDLPSDQQEKVTVAHAFTRNNNKTSGYYFGGNNASPIALPHTDKGAPSSLKISLIIGFSPVDSMQRLLSE